MKRSDQDVENPFKTNEPRLEVEESATCSSPAAEEGPEGHNNSLVDKSASVKKALRLSLELRQELKFLQAASKESSLKKIMEGDERLREWSQVVSSAGYFCEVRSLVSDLSPFPESLVEQGPATNELMLALFITTRRPLCSIPVLAQAVRLIIFPDGEWRLDSPIYAGTQPVKSQVEHSDCQNVLHRFAKTNTKHLSEEISGAS